MRLFSRRIAKAEVPPVEDQLDLEEAIALVKEGLRRPVTEDGREVIDPTPMAPPVGYKRQPSMVQLIREMVRSERLAADLDAAGYETFEEAEDFDVGDDFEPNSPYENEFDPPLKTILADGKRAQDEKKAKKPTPGPSPEPRTNSDPAD